MGRSKIAKFEAILNYPNVIENYDQSKATLIKSEGVEVDLHDKWASDFFNNDKPVVLELACGRGEYSLQLGRNDRSKNFLGVDIKGARIWKGASIALSEGLHNVGFLRTRIELIDQYFSPNEVDSIWITFPDPFHAKENRRLTAPSFLKRYQKFLKHNGTIHLKTDDDILYEYTMEIWQEHPDVNIIYHNDDIYASTLYRPELEYKTYYETMHLGKGKTIKYIEATLSNI